MPLPHVHIVILNWNGWRDTVECLDSITKSGYPNYCAVVVDNGSVDDSCERIGAWAETGGSEESPRRVVSYSRSVAENGGMPETEQELSLLHGAQKLVVIRCEENLGFAGGCNVGIRYAMAVGSEFVWLLNNDTVVEHAALTKSISFMQSHPEYQGMTGQIRLYGNPGVIWNCGGRLTLLGSRRYYFSNRQVADAPQHGFRDISFITGCAPLFRTLLFEKVGLLSDLFFHGEEDYELSLRLKRMGFRLACLYDAIIYHKVGRSIGVASRGKDLSMIYIFYLNRFIDMRNYWPESAWRVWRLVSFFYICPFVKANYRVSWEGLWGLRRALLRDSAQLDRVSKATFERALSPRFGEEVLGQ